MNTAEMVPVLTTLYSELVDGAPEKNAFILNGGDIGLLRSLDTLTADDASRSNDGGATIAAHADHVRYGISLMNRWVAGETNPWKTADWSASWRIATVDENEWTRIRSELRAEATQWAEHLQTPRDVPIVAMNGIVASIAHVGYHLGAIRQIARKTRGPRETG